MEAVLVDYMGDDLRVVNAARVSFAKESDFVKPFDNLVVEYGKYSGWDDPKLVEYVTYYMGKTPQHGEPLVWKKDKINDQDYKLIKYLAKHGHWTPFAHPQITIREKVPIFVARQRFKHMVGFTYNEVSRRYVDDPPEFYVPDEWRSRPDDSIKQGSGVEVIDYLEGEHEVWDDPSSPRIKIPIKGRYKMLNEHALELYNTMIKNDVAPEQARMVLPQSMYTTYYCTGSLAAWARAYKQRIDPHAQKEIQDLAKMWNEIIEPLFPVSWKALTQDE